MCFFHKIMQTASHRNRNGLTQQNQRDQLHPKILVKLVLTFRWFFWLTHFIDDKDNDKERWIFLSSWQKGQSLANCAGVTAWWLFWGRTWLIYYIYYTKYKPKPMLPPLYLYLLTIFFISNTKYKLMTRCQIWCTIEFHRDPISKVLSEW